MNQKTESNPSTPQPQTAPAPSYGQWPQTQTHIPIDPALQAVSSASGTPTAAANSPYQHYQPYSYYGGHYQYQAPTAATPQPVQQIRTVPVTSSQASTSSAAVDSSDISTLNDAIGSAGVDLRAEEESLHRQESRQSVAYRSSYNEDRTRKQPPKAAFDSHFLGTTMRTISSEHKIRTVPEDAVNYMALALRARLQELVTSMIAAAHHRTDTQFDRRPSTYEDGQPMWSIALRSDVAKQLAVIEKVEREEETRIRRERKERADMAAAHAAALAAQAAGSQSNGSDAGFDDGDAGGKKKRKKDGPGVTARNMSEDVRKKMSNAVASQAAGLGGKYSWMTAASSSTATPARKAAAAAPSPNPNTGPASSSTGGWARPYQSTKKPATPTVTTPMEEDTRLAVTLRDAMFVIEKERGHGGGRGAARRI